MANAHTPKTPINIGAILTLFIFVFLATRLMIIVFHAKDQMFILFILLLMCALGAKLMIRQIIPHHVTGVMNLLTGKVEFLFSGVNFVYPWQVPAKNEDGSLKYTDLKEPIVRKCEKKFTAKDKIMMDVSFSVTLQRDIYLDFDTACQNLRKFNSKDQKWTMDQGEEKITQLLSSYLNGLDSKQISTEIVVQKDLMNSTDYIEKIGNFEKERGILLTLILTNCVPEKKAQAAFDKVAEVESVSEAYDILKKTGMSDEAIKDILNGLYLKNSHIYKVQGLENLTHLEMRNPLLNAAEEKETKNIKKGGKKDEHTH